MHFSLHVLLQIFRNISLHLDGNLTTVTAYGTEASLMLLVAPVHHNTVVLEGSF